MQTKKRMWRLLYTAEHQQLPELKKIPKALSQIHSFSDISKVLITILLTRHFECTTIQDSILGTGPY